MLKDRISQLTHALETTYQQGNRATGGLLGIIRHVVDGIGETRASQAAASIAYYALFSLFPMVLFLIVVMSFFVDQQAAQKAVFSAVAQVFPDSQSILDLISQTVNAVFDLRGEIGLISLVGLLWSASAAFTTLAYNIDVAWVRVRREARPPLLQRLVGIAMILIMGAALILILSASSVARLMINLDTSLLDQLGMDRGLLRAFGSNLVTWGLSYLVFLALYRWVPSVKVPWASAALSALVASLAWQLANAGFTWYLSSGFARYELVYGSLTTIVVLMFWMYLSMMIVLVGAHLSAAIADRQRNGPPPPSPS